MERPCPAPVDPVPGFSVKWWLLATVVLLAWQAWITLGLFGPDQPWQRLIGPEPIVSGQHPLHLYHGWLGIRSLIERGTLCVYDPAFQAGYPRTPVFDGGSRPAELFLAACGGQFCPVSYKVGIFTACLIAPLTFMLAGRGFGLATGGSILAGALGILVWWSVPARNLLNQGDVHLLLTLLSALAHTGLLVRYHDRPGFCTWAGLMLSAGLGWWMMPLLFTIIILPIGLLFYLNTGIRHCLIWHLGLAAALAGGLTINSFWLADWFDYWWLRLPLPTGDRWPIDRAFWSLLEADWWGGPAERGLAFALFGAGLLGVIVCYAGGRRPAARMLGLALTGIVALAVTAGTWEPLRQVGSRRLLVMALGFAVIPAAALLQSSIHWLWHRLGGWQMALVMPILFGPGVWFAWPEVCELAQRSIRPTPFQIGLGSERLELVQQLAEQTTAEARILWEDLPQQPSRWTALLPILTQRSYLGGLDPEATVEHAFAAFVDRLLAGRPIHDWSDADLEAFCCRYNIGWVVGWSPAVQHRLDAWCRQGKASKTVELTNDGRKGWLYTIERDRSFVLKGQATFLKADRQRIALTDIVPDDGKVVLSLHYQNGMRVSPPRVQIEPDPDPWDPIPFIRLVVPEPLTVITLSWDSP